MSALVAGHMFMAGFSAMHSLYRIFKPYRVGIYGPSMTGKTTLDQYLTVPGDIDPIPDAFRTTHATSYNVLGHAMPKASRKQIRWKSEKKTVATADIAGQSQFRNMWIEDMFGREVELVIYMIDHRSLSSLQFTLDAVAGFNYLIDNITKKSITKSISRHAKRKSKKYVPKVFCLLINKMDVWWDHNASNLLEHNLLREHPIAMPYRDGLKRLRKAGIRAEVLPVSAQHGINVSKVFSNLISDF